MVAVITGEIIASRNLELLIGELICIFLWGGINYSEGFFIFNDKKICTGRLISIFMCMAAGFVLFSYQSRLYCVMNTMEDNAEVLVRGEVHDIKERENGRTLVLRKAVIHTGKIRIGNESDADTDILKSDKVYLYDNGKENIQIGDLISSGKAIYMKFTGAGNKGNFDDEKYYKSIGVAALFYTKETKVCGTSGDVGYTYRRWIFNIRRYIYNVMYKVCDEDAASVLEAMLLGSRQNMDGDTEELYKDAGIFHVCCISGTHMAIIGLGLYKLLRRRHGYAFSVAVTGIVVVAYGVLAGMGMSVMRAVIMILLKLLSEVLGRTYDMMSAMSLSSVIIICIYPYSIYNTGFILSYAAVAAISVVNPVLIKVFVRPGCKGEAILKGIMFSAGIQLTTIPIIAYCNFEIPLSGIILNLVVIPCLTYIILSGIAGILAGSICTVAGRFLIATASYGVKLYKIMSEAILNIPYMQIVTGKPQIWQIGVYYIILTVVLYAGWKFYKRDKEFSEDFFYVKCMKCIAACMTLIILTYVIVYTKHGSTDIHMIDVGQGDSIHIRTENGINFLIDAGSSDVKDCGKYRVLPCLKAEGVKCIDYIVVTHGDEDHINAVATLMQEKIAGKSYVNTLVLPSIDDYEIVFSDLLKCASDNKVNVKLIGAGDSWIGKKCVVECLYPVGEKNTETYGNAAMKEQAVKNATIKDKDTNDKSTVLKISSGKVSMLCVGDLGEKGEKILLERDKGNIEDIDILKVGHHGSKNSSCEKFLDVVKPRIGLISCGINNRYGHPHKETLERLNNTGARVLRTDEMGEIEIRIEEDEMVVGGYKKK